MLLNPYLTPLVGSSNRRHETLRFLDVSEQQKETEVLSPSNLVLSHHAADHIHRPAE